MKDPIEDIRELAQVLKDQHAIHQIQSREMKQIGCDAGQCDICALIARIEADYPEPPFDFRNPFGLRDELLGA